MRKSKAEIEDRQLKVRDLLLKGYHDQDIIKALQISKDVLESDKEAISAGYIKAVTENKYLLARQAEHIMKHLDQLDMIKRKLWEIEEGAKDDDTKGRLEALKTLLTELEHESKILRLIDSTKTIVKNYIHVDKVNILMVKLTEVIQEFVPQEKQKYAFDRIKDLGPILDTECSELVDQAEEEEKK